MTISYNSSLYLRTAINSVLSSNFQDFEYIIGDDCSKDSSWDIISEYSDQRIVRYRNEQNIGEYSNRNKAIQLATGKYLIFIDGDDVIMPNGLDYFSFYLRNFPDAAMLIQKKYYNNVIFPVQISPKLMYDSYINSKAAFLSSSFASNVFKTEILQGEKLIEDIKTGDDEIRIRLGIKYPTVLVAGWLTWPRETPGSSSSTIITEIENLHQYNYEKRLLTQYKDDYDIDPTVFLSKRKRLVYYLTLTSLLKGKFRTFRFLLMNFDFRLLECFKLLIISQQINRCWFDSFSPGNPLTDNAIAGLIEKK